MPDQCLKVHPVPRTKGQLRLKLGHEPRRLADAIDRHRFNSPPVEPLREQPRNGERWYFHPPACIDRVEGEDALMAVNAF
jgi:hypothetical protein